MNFTTRRSVWRIFLATSAISFTAWAVTANAVVFRVGSSRVVASDAAREADAIVVLGAGISDDGSPSGVLTDRLQTALDLYSRGLARRILVTGDHSRVDHDEPRVMRDWLEGRGVPAEAIFMDHAGFDTFSSMARARQVFGLSRPIVVTQTFHLPRALYLARAAGMDAIGVSADRREYRAIGMMQTRELASRPKAWLDVVAGRKPKYRGPAISIEGDGRATE